MSVLARLAAVRRRAERLRTDGQAVAARDLLEPALDAAVDELGTGDPEVLETARLLALANRDLHDLASARRLLEEALAAGYFTVGDGHPVMLMMSAELGGIAAELNNRYEARRNFARVARLGPGVLGEQHPAVQAARHYLDGLAVTPPGTETAQPGPEPEQPGSEPAPPGPEPEPPGPEAEQPGPEPEPPGPEPAPPGREPEPPGAEPGPPGAEPPMPDIRPAEAPGVYRVPRDGDVSRDDDVEIAVRPPGPAFGEDGEAGEPGWTGGGAGAAQPPWRDGWSGEEEWVEDRPPEVGRVPAGPAEGGRPSHRSRLVRNIVVIVLTLLGFLAVVAATAALLVYLSGRSPVGTPSVRGLPATPGGTSGSPPHRAPGGVSLGDQASSVTLTWSDPAAGQVPFMITAGHAGENSRAFHTVDAGTTSYTVTGLNPELDYCFSVVAVYGTSEVGASALVCTSRHPPTSTTTRTTTPTTTSTGS